MDISSSIQTILSTHLQENNHAGSDYFAAISSLVDRRIRAGTAVERRQWQEGIDRVYSLLRQEMTDSTRAPQSTVKFGTSGWRGILGKDLHVRSVAWVTAAILEMYLQMDTDPALREALGVENCEEMKRRGCVVGFDNRFSGGLLALSAVNVLAANGVRIFYAGQATTGILSASVLMRKAAFSINLTPSHNPLQYGGFKFNAADGGPAAPVLTDRITGNAGRIIAAGSSLCLPDEHLLKRPLREVANLEPIDALADWQQLVRNNREQHGLDYDSIIEVFGGSRDIAVAVDCVHGASRVTISEYFKNPEPDRFMILRGDEDVTFGGIAPEPTSGNMQPVMEMLRQRPERLKLGAIIDPDGDRIRFTDGTVEISMNHFGAMAYHFLHEIKGKKGMVAKTVATSNLANAIAEQLGEEVFEPRVGFKEFKPVIGRALVFFEESDGISCIGHTPEKDAYIGLLLALDMVLALNKNLGDYLTEIEERFGAYYPDRDAVSVARKGRELLEILQQLDRYRVGAKVMVGDTARTIIKVIDIDGRKMILDDNSWLMIRPSGTEPKVRFYVEARDRRETSLLMDAAKSMLAEIGLLA